VSIILKGR